MKSFFYAVACVFIMVATIRTMAQTPKTSMAYTVSMPDPKSHYFQVDLEVTGIVRDTIVFKMPQWMPGYYQIMNYGANVENFKVTDKSGKEIVWNKVNVSTWRVATKKLRNSA